jgi:hypothetical protein
MTVDDAYALLGERNYFRDDPRKRRTIDNALKGGSSTRNVKANCGKLRASRRPKGL